MKKYLALLLLLIACQDAAIEKPKQIEDYAIKNGRLIFKDAKAVTQTINLIANKTEDELTKWSESLIQFQSMRAYSITQGTYEGSNSKLPRSILSIISKDGIYQIGDKVIMLKGMTESVYDYKDESTVDKLLKNSQDEATKVSSREITEELIKANSQNSKPNKSASQNLDARYQYEFNDGNACTDRHKFVFESYAYNFYAYLYLGVRIKTEFRQSHDWPFYCHFDDWAPDNGQYVKKWIGGLQFSGSIYSYVGTSWTVNFPPLYAYSTTNLVAEASIVADCIGPFNITASQLRAYSLGSANYSVSPAAWNNIYYCRSTVNTPPPGGGTGGGVPCSTCIAGYVCNNGQCVVDPQYSPPSCPEGSFWNGIECIYQ